METLKQDCYIKTQELNVPFDVIDKYATYRHRDTELY